MASADAPSFYLLPRQLDQTTDIQIQEVAAAGFIVKPQRTVAETAEQGAPQ